MHRVSFKRWEPDHNTVLPSVPVTGSAAVRLSSKQRLCTKGSPKLQIKWTSLPQDPSIKLLTVEISVWPCEEPVAQRTQELQGHRDQGCSALEARTTGWYPVDVQTLPQLTGTDNDIKQGQSDALLCSLSLLKLSLSHWLTHTSLLSLFWSSHCLTDLHTLLCSLSLLKLSLSHWLTHTSPLSLSSEALTVSLTYTHFSALSLLKLSLSHWLTHTSLLSLFWSSNCLTDLHTLLCSLSLLKLSLSHWLIHTSPLSLFWSSHCLTDLHTLLCSLSLLKLSLTYTHFSALSLFWSSHCLTDLHTLLCSPSSEALTVSLTYTHFSALPLLKLSLSHWLTQSLQTRVFFKKKEEHGFTGLPWDWKCGKLCFKFKLLTIIFRLVLGVK